MFAEKNLDILITPSRPPHILEVILENYPDFGAQKRSAQVGLELMEKIKQSKTKDNKFRHGLNDIFSSKDIYSSICNDELTHFQWCLLGIWIFGDLTFGIDYVEKPHLNDFAEKKFANLIKNAVKNRGESDYKMAERTVDSFITNFSIDGFITDLKNEYANETTNQKVIKKISQFNVKNSSGGD